MGAPFLDQGQTKFDFSIFRLGLSNFWIGAWFPFNVFQLTVQGPNYMFIKSFLCNHFLFLQRFMKIHTFSLGSPGDFWKMRAKKAQG